METIKCRSLSKYIQRNANEGSHSFSAVLNDSEEKVLSLPVLWDKADAGEELFARRKREEGIRRWVTRKRMEEMKEDKPLFLEEHWSRQGCKNSVHWQPTVLIRILIRSGSWFCTFSFLLLPYLLSSPWWATSSFASNKWIRLHRNSSVLCSRTILRTIPWTRDTI